MAARLRFLIEARDKSKKGIGEAERNLDGLAQKAKQVGLALGAAFAVDQIANLAKLGATAERVERRFAAFAEEAGGAERVLDAFQEGAGGAVGKMDAMASASRLLQMGLVQDADSMARVVEMATRLGDQTAGATDRVSDFALMLANQSIPRLDNFGISSGRVRARIAELQKQFEGMSREAAFMQAVMEEGGQSLEKLGPRVDDDLAAFERMEAQIADLKVELGQGLLPIVTAAVGIFADLLGAAKPLIETFAKLADQMPAEEMSAGMEKVEKATAAWVEEGIAAEEMADVLAKRANKVSEALDTHGVSVKDLVKWYVKATKGSEIYADVQAKVSDAALAATNSYTGYLAVIDEYNAKVSDSSARVSALTEVQYQTIQMNDLMAAEMRELNMITQERVQAEEERIRVEEEARIKMGETAGQYHETSSIYMTSVVPAMEAAREKTAAVAEAERISAEHGAHLAEVAREMAAAELEAAAAASQHAMSLKDATDAEIARALIGMLDPEAMGAEAFLAASTEIGTNFGLMDEKSIALAENLPKLAQALEDQVIPTENADEALAGLIADAEDGEVKIGNIVRQFRDWPEPANEAQGATDDFAGSVGDLKGPVSEAEEKLGLLEDRLNAVAKDWKVTVSVETTGTLPGGPPVMQYGGVVPGRVGRPMPIIAHGGEVVLNPFQRGAMGGPGGPPLPPSVTNHYGGNTYQVTITDRFGAAMFLEEMNRRERFARIDARM